MGDKFFIKPLNAEGTLRLRFRLSTKKGKIVRFTVQLEILTADTWRPVVRYDNAHGFAHRDELNMDGEIVRKVALSLASLEEVVEYAENDLEDRAEWYIARFLENK